MWLSDDAASFSEQFFCLVLLEIYVFIIFNSIGYGNALSFMAKFHVVVCYSQQISINIFVTQICNGKLISKGTGSGIPGKAYAMDYIFI